RIVVAEKIILAERVGKSGGVVKAAAGDGTTQRRGGGRPAGAYLMRTDLRYGEVQRVGHGRDVERAVEGGIEHTGDRDAFALPEPVRCSGGKLDYVIVAEHTTVGDLPDVRAVGAILDPWLDKTCG